MIFQKNAFAGASGLWSVVWCSAGLSLVVTPDAPGPLAYVAGLSRQAMAEFLRQNGLASVDASSGLVTLGILCMSVGASFAFSLYAADREKSRALTIRSCGAAAFLILLIG